MSEDPMSTGNLELDSISDLFSGAARFVMKQAKIGLDRTAKDGRHRLEKRRLERDREAMWKKLGREVCALVEAGEVNHPGLVRGADRIRNLAEGQASKDG